METKNWKTVIRTLSGIVSACIYLSILFYFVFNKQDVLISALLFVGSLTITIVLWWLIGRNQTRYYRQPFKQSCLVIFVIFYVVISLCLFFYICLITAKNIISFLAQ
ncbi:hypothetical protein CL633_00895 [bacterium]|nr:hypothetical protein [bacterium]